MITMVTGGHGAGKTSKALEISAKYLLKTYIATAEPMDEEMRVKIEIHKNERDATYTTVEEPIQLPEAVFTAGGDVIVVDCLTVWVGNLMHYRVDVDKAAADLIRVSSELTVDIVFITNESSLSLIPADALSRKYMRVLADINKRLAERADNVCLMVSGMPVWLKGGI